MNEQELQDTNYSLFAGHTLRGVLEAKFQSSQFPLF